VIHRLELFQLFHSDADGWPPRATTAAAVSAIDSYVVP